MCNEGRPREVVERCVGAPCIPHNPHVADGLEAFVDSFERMARKHSGKRVTLGRLVAEGHLVVLHGHQPWPGDADDAGIDILRLGAEGQIAEHWDVLQTLPSTSAHYNGMC